MLVPFRRDVGGIRNNSHAHTVFRGVRTPYTLTSGEEPHPGSFNSTCQELRRNTVLGKKHQNLPRHRLILITVRIHYHHLAPEKKGLLDIGNRAKK